MLNEPVSKLFRILCTGFCPTLAALGAPAVCAGTLLKEGPGTYTITVPKSADYTITIAGGQGGKTYYAENAAAARATGVFALNASDSLTVVVGAAGTNSFGTATNGGAGSYVYLTASDTLLLAAGGGGGASGNNTGYPGSLTSSALTVSGGTVPGVDGGDGSCCGASSGLGSGGQSSINTGLPAYVSGGTLVASYGHGSVKITAPPFSISGTVSGLAGSGLSLFNNGGGGQTVSSNGAFSFDDLADGESYDVTVGTQPTAPNQVCSVTGGSGTIATDDVAGISVQCATLTYTVGGTVSGLQGAGLTLLNNADNAQTVSTDGAFVFPAQKDTSNYSITVGAQPENPAQTCAVANDSGKVDGADVNDVLVTCTNDPVRRASVPGPSGRPISVGFSSNDPDCTLTGTPTTATADKPPAGITFPRGLVSFSVGSCSNGARIDVTVDYGSVLPDDASAWKSEPWREISGAAITGNVLNYSVRDGGPLDADGTINGVIVDPVGIGLPATGAGAKSIPFIPAWGLGLVAMTLGIMGARRLRRSGIDSRRS